MVINQSNLSIPVLCKNSGCLLHFLHTNEIFLPIRKLLGKFCCTIFSDSRFTDSSVLRKLLPLYGVRKSIAIIRKR